MTETFFPIFPIYSLPLLKLSFGYNSRKLIKRLTKYSLTVLKHIYESLVPYIEAGKQGEILSKIWLATLPGSITTAVAGSEFDGGCVINTRNLSSLSDTTKRLTSPSQEELLKCRPIA